MKLFLFGVAILSGWLYNELKEFFTVGGLENKLATILLKIIFISLFILFLGVVNFKNQIAFNQ